jgi:NAD(P)-dependent dehydrogenase (short-subunit alcohol dehydrogenase family)
MRPLDEQTVLITGATDGLGRAVATELAAAGATLLIHG